MTATQSITEMAAKIEAKAAPKGAAKAAKNGKPSAPKKAAPKAKAAPKPKPVAAKKAKAASVKAAPTKAGKLPEPPDFSAKTHERFRGKLSQIVELAKAADVKALKAFHINPCSTSPKAMDRYRNRCVEALEAGKAA